MRLCQTANERQIGNVHRRVGRRFEEEHFGVCPDRGLPRGIVSRIDNGHFHTEARQQAIDQPAT